MDISSIVVIYIYIYTYIVPFTSILFYYLTTHLETFIFAQRARTSKGVVEHDPRQPLLCISFNANLLACRDHKRTVPYRPRSQAFPVFTVPFSTHCSVLIGLHRNGSTSSLHRRRSSASIAQGPVPARSWHTMPMAVLLGTRYAFIADVVPPHSTLGRDASWSAGPTDASKVRLQKLPKLEIYNGPM